MGLSFKVCVISRAFFVWLGVVACGSYRSLSTYLSCYEVLYAFLPVGTVRLNPCLGKQPLFESRGGLQDHIVASQQVSRYHLQASNLYGSKRSTV
jgi:hypothetical protein